MAERVRSSGVRIEYDSEVFNLVERDIGRTGRRRRRGEKVTGTSAPKPSPESAGVLAALQASDLSLVDTIDLLPRVARTAARGTRFSGARLTAPPAALEIDLGPDEQALVLVEQDGFYAWSLPKALELRAPPRRRHRGAAAPTRRVRFVIGEGPEVRAGSSPRRGLMQDIVYGGVKAWVFKFAVQVGVKLGVKVLEHNVHEGPVVIRSATDPGQWQRPADLTAVALPSTRTPRVLLLVHGTFSSTVGAYGALIATPFGRAFLEAALAHYDLVLGYDHRTLSETPHSNAADLFECLAGLHSPLPPRIDAVAHSRGGLVLRSLVEAILPVSSSWRAEIGRCVFVAATNDGTLLASPENWRTLADLYTNLAAATARVMGLFGATAYVGLLLEGAVGSVAAFVKAMAGDVIGEEGIPGLAAMLPGGPFVTELNRLQPGQQGPTEARYYVIQSDFEVGLASDGKPLLSELPARLVALLADGLVDQLIREPNDLVVNTRSMNAIDLSAGEFVRDRLDFGKNGAVYHTNYFIRPEVTTALVRWLELPMIGETLARRRSAEGAPPPPVSAETGLVELDGSMTGPEAGAVIDARSPNFVVVRRPYGGRTLRYALRVNEVREELSRAAVGSPLIEALDLHENESSREVPAGTAGVPALTPLPGQRLSIARQVIVRDGSVIAVIPEAAAPPPLDVTKAAMAVAQKAATVKKAVKKAKKGTVGKIIRIGHPPAILLNNGGFRSGQAPRMTDLDLYADKGWRRLREGVAAVSQSMAKKTAPPKRSAPTEVGAPTCHFQAAMPQQVQVKTDATVDVVLSREIITIAAGRAAAGGKGKVPKGSKLVVDLVPKRNFVTRGESRIEVVAPEADAPVECYFDVTATDVGPGEVWVVIRQGVQPLVTLKLLPEVVATVPTARARQSADAPVDVSPPTAMSAPNMLVIHERQNGEERRFTFELYSQQLNSTSQFESRPITGDRAAYVNAIYKSIENTYAESKAQKTNFDEALRAYGATLWDELVPNELQALLWTHRKTLTSILAFSEEPFIPWEIVHLKEPGKRLSGEVRFLGQMGLVRWLHGCGYPPSTLRLRKGRARYVIPKYPDPDYVLPEAEKERVYIEKTFGAKPIEAQEGPVREALSHGEDLDLVHFAGHGMADGGDIAHAQFMLEGSMASGRFIPTYIGATVIEQFANLASPTNRAMVVMNACQTGRVGFQLTSIGGFAPAFLGGGAGLFVSPLWSVGDSPASTFVLTLYEKLKNGKKLGVAAALARETARTSGDATWLAYSVYGNPELNLC